MFCEGAPSNKSDSETTQKCYSTVVAILTSLTTMACIIKQIKSVYKNLFHIVRTQKEKVKGRTMVVTMTMGNKTKGKSTKGKSKNSSSGSSSTSSSMLTVLRRNYILVLLVVLATIQNIYLSLSSTTIQHDDNAIGEAKKYFTIQSFTTSIMTTTADGGGDDTDENENDVEDEDEDEDEEFRIVNKSENRKVEKIIRGKYNKMKGEDDEDEEESVELLYERWNHTTSTITIPNELRPSFTSAEDNNKLTSLEILQSVLHGEEYEKEYLAVDKYIQMNYTLSSKDSIPQCLIPNKDATRKLANEYTAANAMSNNSNNNNSNLFPVLNVGFAKMGTTTLADYFDCAGYYATHDKVGNKHYGNDQNYIRKDNIGPNKGDIHEGIELFKRAKHSIKPLLDYNKARVQKSIDVHCQMDTNRVEGWYPQIKLLDELHIEQSKSTFVLIFRPLKDWLNSIEHWPGIKSRMSRFEMPGLILTEKQHLAVKELRNWHIQLKKFHLLSRKSKEEFIQKYYKENPSVLKLEITKDAASASASAMKKRNLKSKKGKTEKKDKAQHADKLQYPVLRPLIPEPVNDIQLGRWWCSHVHHIREYVKQYPTHKLIELELYDTKTSSEILYDIFQKNKQHDGNENNSCWGHANVNKKAATATTKE